MKMTGRILPVLTVVFLAACGSSKTTTPPGNQSGPSTPNSVTGLVNDIGTSARLAGVTVTGGGQTTTTAADGTFQLKNLAAGKVSLTFSKTGYAPGFVNGQSSSAGGDALILTLKQTGSAQAYDPTAAATFVEKTEAGSYTLALDANSIDLTGSTPPYTVSITPLDPTKQAGALPGNLDASGAGTSVLLPVTFAEYSILDSAGKRLNLKSTASATVELPLPAALRASYPETTTIHCYAYSPTAGSWNDFVTGTVRKSAEDGVTPVLAASLRHFSWYGGAPQGTDCVDQWVHVVSAVDGKPLPNARVEATPGTVAWTDASGDAYLRSAVGPTSSTYTAYQTGYDVDGSLTGISGAKYIEFGRVEETLTGLTTVPCSNPITPGAKTSPLIIKVGTVKNLLYEATAVISAASGGSPGSIMVFLEQGIPGPDGTIDSATRTPAGGAKITLTPSGGSPVAVTEIMAGSAPVGEYMATFAALMAGQSFTLAIDADGNGSIDGFGTASAIGTLDWSNPLAGATVSAADLAGVDPSKWITISDTGTAAANPAYAPIYEVIIAPASGSMATSEAIYIGTDRSFPATDAFNATLGAPLLPGSYDASLIGFSGFAGSAASGFTISNNITGANVTGIIYSISSGPNITFTVN
jgi:hypothetical protein